MEDKIIIIKSETLANLSASINQAYGYIKSEKYFIDEMQREIGINLPVYLKANPSDETVKRIEYNLANDLAATVVLDNLIYSISANSEGEIEYTCEGYYDHTSKKDTYTVFDSIGTSGRFKVTKIKTGAFKKYNANTGKYSGNLDLVSVTLPSTLKITTGDKGDSRILQGCQNLKNVTFEEGYETISYMMFDNCYGLEEITLPESLKTIDDYAFKGSGLKTLTIPDSVTSIGTSALTCRYLETVYFGNGIKNSMKNVFNALSGNNPISCESLTDIYVPWSEGEVAGAPWGAPSTTNIHYNYTELIEYLMYEPNYDYIDGEETIVSYTCIGLRDDIEAPTEITIPRTYNELPVITINGHNSNFEGVEKMTVDINGYLDYYGLGGVSTLKEVIIGSAVTPLNEYGLGNCPNLERIIIDENNPYLKAENNYILSKDGTILYYGNGHSGEIPDGVKVISYGALYYSTATDFDIPDGVWELQENALPANSVVKIPLSLNEIGLIGVPRNGTIICKYRYIDIENPLVPEHLGVSKVIYVDGCLDEEATLNLKVSYGDPEYYDELIVQSSAITLSAKKATYDNSGWFCIYMNDNPDVSNLAKKIYNNNGAGDIIEVLDFSNWAIGQTADGRIYAYRETLWMDSKENEIFEKFNECIGYRFSSLDDWPDYEIAIDETYAIGCVEQQYIGAFNSLISTLILSNSEFNANNTITIYSKRTNEAYIISDFNAGGNKYIEQTESEYVNEGVIQSLEGIATGLARFIIDNAPDYIDFSCMDDYDASKDFIIMH